MKGRILILLFSFLACQITLAQVYQCPVTNAFINTGDALDSVLKACGKPLSQTTKTAKPQPAVEEWTYLRTDVTPNVRFTLVIKDNVVQSITINNKNVSGPTFLCAGYQPVRPGMDKQTIQNRCGFPTSRRILKPATKDSKITTLIYRPQTYMPSRVFTFENGVLVSAKDVQ